MGGLAESEIRRAYSFRNFIKHDSLRNMQKWYGRRALNEAKMLKLSGNIIIENEWAKANCLQINSECRYFEYRQRINKLFFDLSWDLDKCQKHTIFCTAPVNYPLKGLHQTIKALAIIKKKYHDVKLRVPGMADPFIADWKAKLKQDGYVKYLMRLIIDLGLRENVIFLGRLNSAQIGDELLDANVFVVSSCIENISISLREAMVVGTPTVASAAGGIPESIHDGIDGRLYRFEEYAQLAYQIMDFFEDNTKARTMSQNARKSMRNYLSQQSDTQTLLSIYRSVLNNGINISNTCN